MKVLAVSDIESPSLYDYFSPEKVEGVELIVGCGDLRMEYLEFLVTMMNVPLIYIHGNHDDHFRREPEGCICIDDDVFEYKGLRFVGLGGSIRYKEGKYMFTEREMRSRIRKLWWKIRHPQAVVENPPSQGLRRARHPFARASHQRLRQRDTPRL